MDFFCQINDKVFLKRFSHLSIWSPYEFYLFIGEISAPNVYIWSNVDEGPESKGNSSSNGGKIVTT